MLCLSKVSRLLPSTLAQSCSRARFLGHCPPPWPLLTWASRLPGEFCSHLTASLLRCIFSCCALREVPECLAFSGDCWLSQDAIVLSPSLLVTSKMGPKQVCIPVLGIWTPGHITGREQPPLHELIRVHMDPSVPVRVWQSRQVARGRACWTWVGVPPCWPFG